MFDSDSHGALFALAATPKAEVFDLSGELMAEVDERQRLLDFLAGREVAPSEDAKTEARPISPGRHRLRAALVLIAEEGPLWQAG
jgi:hypothetical protein